MKHFHKTRLIRWSALTFGSMLMLLAPQALFAQGCALCYTQAAGSTQRFIQALRSGILILVIPPMFLSVMFTVMAYTRRKASYDEFLPEADASCKDLT